MGCGINSVMSRKFKGKELQMLILSMFPGISAGSYFSWFNDDNVFKNSGYGLYITKELALAYDGSFMLCSGNYALNYNTKGSTYRKKRL